MSPLLSPGVADRGVNRCRLCSCRWASNSPPAAVSIRSAPARPTWKRRNERRPADLSEDIAAAIRLAAELPPVRRLRPITSPAAPVTALLRSDAVVVINPDIIRPAPLGFPLCDPLPPAAGEALSADGDTDTPLRPGEVRILRCRPTRGLCRRRDRADPALGAVKPHRRRGGGTGRRISCQNGRGPGLHGHRRRVRRRPRRAGRRSTVAAGGFVVVAARSDDQAAQRPVGGASPPRTDRRCTGSRSRAGGINGAPSPMISMPRSRPVRIVTLEIEEGRQLLEAALLPATASRPRMCCCRTI